MHYLFNMVSHQSYLVHRRLFFFLMYSVVFFSDQGRISAVPIPVCHKPLPREFQDAPGLSVSAMEFIWISSGYAGASHRAFGVAIFPIVPIKLGASWRYLEFPNHRVWIYSIYWMQGWLFKDTLED